MVCEIKESWVELEKTITVNVAAANYRPKPVAKFEFFPPSSLKKSVISPAPQEDRRIRLNIKYF